MSTINLYESYQQKTRKFGVNDSDRFRESFVEAVNQCYAEINSEVFQNQTLPYINSFDDVIDTKLRAFTSVIINPDKPSAGRDGNDAISNMEFWTAEWDFERLGDTNSFSEVITDSGTLTFSIANNVLTITGSTIVATAAIPDGTTLNVKFTSSEEGNSLTVNDEPVALTYSTGDSETTQEIGTVSANVISGMSGFSLNRIKFNSGSTALYDFLMNDDGILLTDSVAGYEAGVTGGFWKTVWLEPSSGLDSQYRAIFDVGMDYHLQDGGEWAIESESSRYQKWYGDPSTKQKGGIQMARNIYQINSTYTSPLGI